MSDEYLTISEAAEALQVSEITVKRYIYAGHLKSHKLPGGRHRIPRSEIERLLGGGEPEPAPEAVIAGLEARVAELEEALEHIMAELQVLAAWCERRAESLPETKPSPKRRRIEVLGPGCNKCRKLYATVQQVVAEHFPEQWEVAHITDVAQITAYGPLLTPALVIDGQVVSAGRVLLPEEVQGLLHRAQQSDTPQEATE